MTPVEIIDMAARLMAARQPWDRVWQQIARFVMPVSDREFGGQPGLSELEGWMTSPNAARSAADRYDVTALISLERLASGIVSLATPDNDKWQHLGVTDKYGGMREADDAEKRWLDGQRDYLFAVRYNPRSGWSQANKAAIRSMCAFGTGVYVVEERYSDDAADVVRTPYRCTTLPLSSTWLDVDGNGVTDLCLRRVRMSARALAATFGERVSGKVKALASDPRRWSETVDVWHLVWHRRETGRRGDPMRKSPVESIYIEADTKHEIQRGGFGYWPIVDYHWNRNPNQAYGESPVMLILPEVRSLNLHGKNALLASNQWVKPPLGAVADYGKPFMMTPGAVNAGALTPSGDWRIKPFVTSQDPRLVNEIIETSREVVKSGLYTNLWMTLTQNPQMTATQALIMANEKGELLGPVGSNIEHGLSVLTDAELSIISGKGAWRPEAANPPPPSLAGADVRPVFASPLTRLRRTGELLGVQRTVETAMMLAQLGRADVLERLDADAILDLAQEVNGAPRKMFLPDDVVEQRRAQKAMAEQMQQQLAMVQQAADAGAKASQALPAAGALARLTGNPALAEVIGDGG